MSSGAATNCFSVLSFDMAGRYWKTPSHRSAGPPGWAEGVAQHRRRAAGPRPCRLTDPPDWFTAELVGIWNDTLDAAAPGSLAAIDRDNLVAYCVAVRCTADWRSA